MKLGIFTYHFTKNPGSILQAYALQKKLEELGYESELINYQKKNWKKTKYQKVFKNIFGKFSFLVAPIGYFLVWYRDQKNAAFRKKYMNCTKKIEHRVELNSIKSKYDKFIVGSDQIWNYHNAKFDYTYLLDFIENSDKKVSYAASFGVDNISKERRNAFKDSLGDYFRLSVREKAGQRIINKLIGEKPPVLLDPVMLVDKKEWSELAQPPNLPEKYILLYLRKNEEAGSQFVRQLAKNVEHEIVQVVGFRKRKYNFQYFHNATPREWLGLFANAEQVVTNSFHGSVFSILFEKEFYIVPHKSSPQDTNSRLVNLAEIFSLEDRLVKDIENFKKPEPINYPEVCRELKARRKQSLAYLNSLRETA